MLCRRFILLCFYRKSEFTNKKLIIDLLIANPSKIKKIKFVLLIPFELVAVGLSREWLAKKSLNNNIHLFPPKHLNLKKFIEKEFWKLNFPKHHFLRAISKFETKWQFWKFVLTFEFWTRIFITNKISRSWKILTRFLM